MPKRSIYPQWLEAEWASIVAAHDPNNLLLIGSAIIQLITFYIPALISCFVLPPLGLPYPKKSQPPSKQPSYRQAIKGGAISLRNSLLVFCLQVLSQRYVLDEPQFRVTAPLPPPTEVIRCFAVAVMIREAMFYYTHRMFHHPRVYKHIHKKHHEFVAPVALAAQYATFTEHLLANVVPVVVPCALQDAHIISFWCFQAFATGFATLDHAGWDVGVWTQKHHDDHHKVFDREFGTIGVMDWIHGTRVGDGKPGKGKKHE